MFDRLWAYCGSFISKNRLIQRDGITFSILDTKTCLKTFAVCNHLESWIILLTDITWIMYWIHEVKILCIVSFFLLICCKNL